jgi:hypothetical protein
VRAVDVVVVAFNSRERLRGSVEGLAGLEDVRVVVVDNASTDGSLDSVADLSVERVALPANGGFARACNVGWRMGTAPLVLFLNPDASLGERSLRALAGAVDSDTEVAAAGPRMLNGAGALEFSQRRFPRLRSTFAQALLLHRVFPLAGWSDEVVRDVRQYERAGSPEWLSGACLLVRRSALELVGGFDDRFFLYCEDTDLCLRLRIAGFDVRFVPDALCVHQGGASAPRSSLLPTLASSRIRYAEKHHGSGRAALERAGVCLSALTHALVTRRGAAARGGHARSLRLALARRGTGADGRG